MAEEKDKTVEKKTKVNNNTPEPASGLSETDLENVSGGVHDYHTV